ncbi:MAG: carbohydrate binding family 9 domain-containing protein [Acidobacteria bacterium]|nr:carbohydrate binding family 9 domain-containing protein [Acidobacteriota bacterium]
MTRLPGRQASLARLAFLLVFIGPRVALAQNGHVELVASRLIVDGTHPVIDGRVSEEVWLRVQPYTTFIQQDPNEGEPASERTEVRILFDRRAVYIGIICFDSDPSKIIVSQSRRDSDLTDSDSVEVLLDTFNDGQNAFVFGTNPIGIEYDGQVAGEGQTGGFNSRGAGARGSQRGQITGFNPNWDGDWSVKSQRTERGWETEMLIPLKTLRYNSGAARIWGFNVMRNIRRKNEQVYLAPIPRGYGLTRVSDAAKLSGLDLPPRRDVKAIPFVATSFNKDYTVQGDPLDRKGDVGLDVKWGIRPNLTADFTVNTDFAQVEADEEQINLTRFALFFPEKRGFFLENASMFQMGVPQQADLFFSRRIGLSASGLPIGIIGGARLSGKVGGYNVGLLNMLTEETTNARSGRLIAPANSFSVARIQREVGRSNFGAMFVNRQAIGDASGPNNYNRAYGVDAAVQMSTNGKLFSYIARSDTPGASGSDYAGRIQYAYATSLFNASLGYSQVGERFNPEVGFVPRRGYRLPSARFFLTYQPTQWPWIRRISSHWHTDPYYGFDGRLQSSSTHYHYFEIQPAGGGRFGSFVDRKADRPLVPFTVFSAAGKPSVVIPPRLYTWNEWAFEYITNPSAPVSGNIRYTIGDFYNGDLNRVALDVNVRVGALFSTAVGYNLDDIVLPYGRFATKLLSLKINQSFTTRSNLQALIQYNNQTAQVSSNIRLALLNRSGTGLFIVYNDRRDVSPYTRDEVLGRSFIMKYTRLFDF